VARDKDFYDPVISPDAVAAMNDFARSVGLLDAPVPYEQVVDARFAPLWKETP
jgi:hypothetical protein